MPELPDVEAYKRYLDATALHSAVEQVEVQAPEILEGTTPQGLGRALKGHVFANSRRHGKYLLVQLDDGPWLTLHFGMTGDLLYHRQDVDTPAHTQCRFSFGNGYELDYIAPRKLGHIGLVSSPKALAEEHDLGPDALDMDEEAFLAAASGRRGSVKSWLMNQSVMAGIGNVYSDEILFQARLHPRRSLDSLDKEALLDLYRAMQSVLKIAARAADRDQLPKHFLLPHRGKQGRCPDCGGRVQGIRVAGRTAWYCPRCQPE